MTAACVMLALCALGLGGCAMYFWGDARFWQSRAEVYREHTGKLEISEEFRFRDLKAEHLREIERLMAYHKDEIDRMEDDHGQEIIRLAEIYGNIFLNGNPTKLPDAERINAPADAETRVLKAIGEDVRASAIDRGAANLKQMYQEAGLVLSDEEARLQAAAMVAGESLDRIAT